MESEPRASTRIERSERASRTVVSLDGVDVAIAGTRILSDLAWHLETGAHWGVTGRNGSGKSTFLALVAGQRWPVPGKGSRRYDFGAGPERDAVTARRRITLVGHELQERYVALDWNFTAVDVVLSGLYGTDVPRRRPEHKHRREAERLLAELELGELAERAFLELSHGEQRRVLIARAFAFAPDVLALDEPASGLDRTARAKLETLLARTPESTQIVVAAHTTDQLPGIVTHWLELEDGRIARQGPLEARARERAMTTPARRAAPRDTRRIAHGDPLDEPLVEIRNATVWLGGRPALEHVDWRLGAGEHWLVTGGNGAGKSTLLRLVHGQVRPARGGTVRWPGLGDPRDVWQLRRLIGWVSAELQAAYLYRATVAECIGSGLAASIGLVRALSASERARVAELVRAFELASLESQPLTSLSYGQRRRALIARALVSHPRVLLLDEPWEGLDPDTIALVAERLDAARAEGVQLVCASHIGDYGLGLERELTLERGRVIAAGMPGGDGAVGARRESSASARSRARDSRAR